MSCKLDNNKVAKAVSEPFANAQEIAAIEKRLGRALTKREALQVVIGKSSAVEGVATVYKNKKGSSETNYNNIKYSHRVYLYESKKVDKNTAKVSWFELNSDNKLVPTTKTMKRVEKNIWEPLAKSANTRFKFGTAIDDEVSLLDDAAKNSELLRRLNGYSKKEITNKLNKENNKVLNQQNGPKGNFDNELDKKLRGILQKLYPKIKLNYSTDIDVKGQADIDAKTVLINSLLQSQDTLPHEYAHHYIRMFADTPIVKQAIKKWGSEEALVQAIGEQSVKQKGQAYGWWKKFGSWIRKIWIRLPYAEKEELKNLLTDAMLTNKDISWHGAETDKTYGIDLAYSNNKTLSSIGSKSTYLSYINSIFPYSKMKNIAYHNTSEDMLPPSIEEIKHILNDKNLDIIDTYWAMIDYDDNEKLVAYYKTSDKVEHELTEKQVNELSKNHWSYTNKFNINKAGSNEGSALGEGVYFLIKGEDGDVTKEYSIGTGTYRIPALLNIKNPLSLKEYQRKSSNKELSTIMHSNSGRKITDKLKLLGYDSVYGGHGGAEVNIFDTKNVHILGSKEDEVAFKKWVKQNGETIDTSYFKNHEKEMIVNSAIISRIKRILDKTDDDYFVKVSVENMIKDAKNGSRKTLEELPLYLEDLLEKDIANTAYKNIAKLYPKLLNTVEQSNSNKNLLKQKEKAVTEDNDNSQQKALKSLVTYGATKKDKNTKLNKKFKKQDRTVIDDVAGAVAFGNKLDEMAVHKETDAEHKGKLLEWLEVIVGKNYLPKELNVYVNKTARETAGIFVQEDTKEAKAGVYVALGRNNTSGQSALEKYVHELTHAAQEYAIASKDPKVEHVLHRLRNLHRSFLRDVTADMLVQKGASKKEANKLIKYMNGKDGFSEFMVHGATNKYVSGALEDLDVYKQRGKSENMWQAFKSMVADMIDAISLKVRKESKDMKGIELLMKLNLQLMSANNYAESEMERGSIAKVLGNAYNGLNDAMVKAYDLFETELKTGKIEPIDENASAVGKAIWISKNVLKIYNHEFGRAHFENMLNAIGLSHDGLLQHLIRSFRNNDKLENVIENFGLLTQEGDRNRYAKKNFITKKISEAFNGEITKEQEKLLTTGLVEVDVQLLPRSGKEAYRLMDLYDDSDYLDSKIKELEKRVGKGKNGNYYKAQAQGLGRYMVTHRASKGQLLNATNIAKMINREMKYDVTDELIRDIDRLATLQGIKQLDSDTKTKVAEMFKENGPSVTMVIEMHRSHAEVSKETLFGESVVNYIKGYSSEIFNEDYAIEYAPIADKVRMKRDGFEYVRDVPGMFGSNGIAMYRNKHALLNEYNKQAVRTTDTHRKGTSIMDIVQKARPNATPKELKTLEAGYISRSKQEMNADVDEMIKTGKMPELPASTVTPTFDAKGGVQSYRIVMNKEDKRELLGRDEKIQFVMSQMYSTQMDKIMTKDHNKKVFKELLADVAKNVDLRENGLKIANNYKDYTYIGNPNDKSSMEEWSLIPKPDRDRIKKEMEKIAVKQGNYDYEFAGFPIRSDVKRMVMGSRNYSIADSKVIQWGDKAVGNKELSNIIREGERLWKDMVSIAKVNIVIKMPAVFVANYISNFILSLQSGMTIKEVVELQRNGLEALKDYSRLENELMETKLKMNSVTTPARRAKYAADVARIQEEMKNNSAADLVEAGFHSQIVEDSRPEDTRDKSKLSKFIKEKREFINNPAVNNAINYLWLTEDTGLYKEMLKIIQSQDFVARYAKYHVGIKKDKGSLIKKLGRQLTKSENAGIEQKHKNIVRDYMINYNKLDPTGLKYANDMGLIMFTKFFIGSQRVIKDVAAKKPLNALAGMALQSVLHDYDDIMNHSILSYDPTKLIHGAGDIIEYASVPWLWKSPELMLQGVKAVY